MTYSKQVCEGGAIGAAGDILEMALRTADDAFSSCASTLQHEVSWGGLLPPWPAYGRDL